MNLNAGGFRHSGVISKGRVISAVIGIEYHAAAKHLRSLDETHLTPGYGSLS
jgi:hypothetical protein